MKLKAIAYHLEERLKVLELQKKFDYTLIRKEHSYLFYQVDEQSFIYIKDFGSVVFVDCGDDLIKETIFKLIIQTKLSYINDFYDLHYKIMEEKNKKYEKLKFNYKLSKIKIKKIHNY